MKKGIRRVLVLLLALSMVFTTMGLPAYADTPTLDGVLAQIGELSNDPREIAAGDQEKIEALFADYQALSAEDQATVDSTFDHPSGDGQSYGRILEAALWAARSYSTDTSTTLANGTYTTTTERAVSSVSDKGKSDSSRVRNWWVESVVVEDGQAKAYIYVTSGAATAKKVTSYPSVWIGGQSIPKDENNNYEIPIDLNGTTYFGGVSSSMPRPIMYKLDTEIDESSAEPELADYSAVDAALAKVPEDLSKYTDETAQAVTDAVAAVVRDKTSDKQAEVDAMAQAIEDAVAALEEKPAETPEKIDLAITNHTGMFKAVTAYLTTEGDQEYLVMALSGSGYAELFKGTYEQAVVNGDGKNNDTWIHGYTNADGKLEFKIPMNADETYVPCVSVSNSYYNKYLNGQNSLERSFYPRQFTLDREAKTLVTGDYEFTQALEVTNNVKMFKVSDAKIDTVGGPNSNSYKSDMTLTMGSDSFDKFYAGRADAAAATETTVELGEGNTFVFPVRWVETFGMPESMKTLIGEPFIASFHSVKNDIWYEREITIDETAGTITFNSVPADYSAVDAALAKVPEDLSKYTDETAQAVTDAVAAVVRDKTSDKQAEVDAMAKAIEDAVAALEEKSAEPVLADGTYTATKVSTDVTTDASGMIMVTKATVVIKDGQATAIVTMKGTGADRLYISDTATKDTIISEAVAEEAKEIDGQFSNLIGCYQMEGESAYSFWPIPIELGTPKIYAARSASHFNKWDTPREKYFYLHDFQIDAADLVRVSDSTDIMSPEIDAEVLVNQFYVNNGISSNHAGVIKAKNANVTVPYYDGDTKISSFNFKRPDASEYVSGWFIDDDGLNMLTSSSKKKVRYPGFTSAFSMSSTKRDAGGTFTATLKLYPTGTFYDQYDGSEVYFYTDSTKTTPAVPLTEKSFTVTVEDKPQIDFNVGVAVTDQKSGDAIADPTITVTDESDNSVVTPNEDGTYKLNALKKYTVAASADGYVAQGGAAQATKTGFSPSKEGETVSLKLLKESEASHTLTFSFTDQFDEAVVNPAVKVTKYGTTEEVAANADGSYTLWDSEEYRYEATAEGYKTETGYLRLTEDSAESVKMNKYLSEYKVTYTIRDQVTDEVIENPTLVLTNNTDGTTIPQNEDGSFTVPADKSITCVASKENYQSEHFTTVTDSSINFEPEIKYSFSLEHSYKWQLADEISAAQEYAAGMVESDKPGEWETGSKATLEAAIEDAQTAHDKADATEEDFEEALKTLKAAEKAAANAQHWFEANVTVRVNKTPGGAAELYKIKVSGEASKTYKYAEPAKVGKQVSFIDVLAALHEEIYGDAFKADPTVYFDSQNVGFYYIAKLFGLGNYYQFAINGESTGSYQNCIVQDGDTLDVSLMQKTNDVFLAFDQLETSATVDSAYTTTLHAGVSTKKPAEGYTVTYVDAEGHEVSGVTDAEGKLTVTFDKDGEYIVKSVVKETESNPLVQPYQKVTVEKKPADYSAVEAAKAAVPEDLSIYTDETVKAVNDAVAAVIEGKKIDEQEAVDAMAKAINDAVAALEKKPADYSAVEVAQAAVPEDLSIYTDETVKAVNDAVAAVIEGKKIDEQEAVDAMAKAINDAVAALEKKPADYSAVEEAKAGIPEDLSIYTAETKKAVEDAVAAVVEGKKIDEQADVDEMAQAIEDAVADLKIDITKAEVDADDEMTVTGEALEPSVTVVLNGEELEEDVDFTVAYKDNVEVGEATIVITGIGDYAGTVEKTFIIRPDITGADDQREETFVRLLAVKIGDKDASLYTPDTFAVYEEAKATLESLLDDEWATAEEIKEARLDYLRATYALVEKDEQTITGPEDAITKTYGNKAFSLGAKTDGDGQLTYASSNEKVAAVDASGKVTIKAAGTAKITITAAATDTCKEASKTVTLTVNKKAQKITVAKAKITKKYGAKAFSLKAKTSGDGKLTYKSSNTKVATVSKTGQVTIKGAGTAKITVKAAAAKNYKAASKTVTVKVSKAANKMKASGRTASVKASKVKKASKTIAKAKAFKVSKATGKVTFKKASGNAKIKVSKTGKITVKKGLKKGTYKVKIKVKAAGNSNVKPMTKTVTVKIKVKK